MDSISRIEFDEYKSEQQQKLDNLQQDIYNLQRRCGDLEDRVSSLKREIGDKVPRWEFDNLNGKVK